MFSYLLVSMGVVDAIDGIPGSLDESAISLPTYFGFISVMMTAVTVVLAALAIGIGVVATCERGRWVGLHVVLSLSAG